MVHPRLLKAFVEVQNVQFDGYGLDSYCADATALIRQKFGAPCADIHFIPGGTHANLVVISSVLRPHEAVIAPLTGHIFVHETGAIEATGHKVCTRAGYDGKLSVSDIESVLSEHPNDEHMVRPRLVYISLSTEAGTVYTKSELSSIYSYCRENSLFLYIDGARLGAALNSPACDLTYHDIAALSDAFFVGGTKNGALFGEAIVIQNDRLKEDFRYLLKQRGGLLAKSAAIGVQFKALFADGLYDELAAHANRAARKLADGIRALGYEFLYPAQTNLLIPIFPAKVAVALHQLYAFYDWQTLGDMTAVRLLTSWATQENIVDEFISDLKGISG